MVREESLDRLRRISSAERRVLLWLLKSSRTGTIDFEAVKEWSGVSRDIVESVFERFGIENGKSLTTDDLLRIAMILFGSRVSAEELSISLTWSLFEELAACLFEHAGLNVIRGTRVKIGKHKAQIDLLAFTQNSLYLVECKRWRRSVTIGLIRSIEDSMRRRVVIIRELLSRAIGIGDLEVRIIPLLLTVYGSPYFDEVLFHSPLRLLKSFLSEPVVSLPSPPVQVIRLSGPLTFQNIKSLYR